MNQVRRSQVDPDAHLMCAICKDLTADGENLLKFEHGDLAYIEHLDMLACDVDREYILCEMCAVDAYRHLINMWDEAEEFAFDNSIPDFGADDASWVRDMFLDSADVPRTWFHTEEPDQCPCCNGSHDHGDPVVQVSIVHRHGRKFTPPIEHGEGRYTWFCENCVSEFYGN